MSQPTSNKNEPSRPNQLLNSQADQSIKARLPRAAGTPPPKTRSAPPSVEEPDNSKSQTGLYKFRPAFWTIASVISLSVNVVLLIALLVIYQMLGGLNGIISLAQSQANGLLGGLYQNFVKMDQATISTTIAVDANIPLDITVPVQTSTNIALAEDVVIPNARVKIDMGGAQNFHIDADAIVTLPAGTPLTVSLDFPLQVKDTIPVHLDVPVNIPLNQTELHDPFVGLRMVVQPYYCFLQPNTIVDGINVCSPVSEIQNNPGQTTP